MTCRHADSLVDKSSTSEWFPSDFYLAHCSGACSGTIYLVMGSGTAVTNTLCNVTVFSCNQAALQMVFSVRPSVRPSVTPFWLCSHHRIIMKFSGVITSDRVSSGQGKVREIPDLAKVREKSGNFVEGQGKNEYWEKSGKNKGICI